MELTKQYKRKMVDKSVSCARGGDDPTFWLGVIYGLDDFVLRLEDRLIDKIEQLEQED